MWHNINREDIEIDRESEEINVYVSDDRWGSVYAVLTFDQIMELADEIEIRGLWTTEL